MPWKLTCDADGLTRSVTWGIAKSINFNTSGLVWMNVWSSLTIILEPLLVYVLFKAKMQEGFGNGGGFACMLAVFSILQMVFLISFAASYTSTDADYQKIMANSAQLSDFNRCGDSYMQIDTNEVFGNIAKSRSNLKIGVQFAVLAIFVYAFQSVCVVFRVLALTKPAYN